MKSIIDQLTDQTVKPDEIIVLVSGSGWEDIRLATRNRVTWMKMVDDKNDWGHHKRKTGLEWAKPKGKIGFFNDDDEYDPTYIEKMTAHKEDLVYCDFTTHLYNNDKVDSTLDHGKCTSGNFVVNSKKAKEVGYNHLVYHADWLFIKELLEAGITTRKVPETLYFHK